MAEILRVKARWGGFTGAPGYSVFHFRDFEGNGDQNGFAQGAADRTRSFFDGFRVWLAPNVTIQVLGEVEVVEETNGQIVDVVGVTQPAVVTSGASVIDRYAAAVGAVVTWRTSVVRNGRRVKGRTFIVPLKGDAYGSDGTLHTDFLGAINPAAAALHADAGSPDLGVYARPTAPGANDGAWYQVSSHSIPDISAVLRSRRD